jgi:hypothetical protein
MRINKMKTSIFIFHYIYFGNIRLQDVCIMWRLHSVYTKKLRNRICYVGYIERTSVDKTECSSSVCLHYVVFVSVRSWLCCVRVRVKESKNWSLCRFFKRSDCLWTLFVVSVIETATLLSVSISTFSKVMPAYTNHRKTTSGNRNSGLNSTLTERGRRILRRIISTNHTTTAAQVTAEVNIHLEDPVSTKTVLCGMSLTNPTSTVGLHLLNLWLLKIMLRCVNDGVTTIKPGH